MSFFGTPEAASQSKIVFMLSVGGSNIFNTSLLVICLPYLEDVGSELRLESALSVDIEEGWPGRAVRVVTHISIK